MNVKFSQGKDQQGSAEKHDRYRCQYCEVEYKNELLTRVHITRASDDAHRNYDGFMPETPVEAINENGNIIETIQRHPNELDTRSLTLTTFPDEFSEQKKRVLLLAAYQPQINNITELHERATVILKEHDLEPISYSTTRNWIREFYTPKQQTGSGTDGSPVEDNDDAQQSLGDLTPKQQAVVIHHVADPDASDGEIAKRADCSRSYPYHVYDYAADVIERLKKSYNAGTSLEELIGEELEPEAITELRQGGYLDDFHPVFAEGKETDSGEEIRPGEDPTTDNTSDSVADGPVTNSNARFLTASPTDELLIDMGNQSTKSGSTEEQSTDNSDSSTNQSSRYPPISEVKSDPSTQASMTAEIPERQSIATTRGSELDMVPKRDLETVIDRVRFLRRVFEREVETTPEVDRAHIQLAITKEIELELNHLL